MSSSKSADMERPKIITVTLNPCMDKTVEVAGFAAGKTNRVLTSRTDVGGKGVNVARALLGCGEPFLATGLAAGTNGRRLTDTLSQMGVPCAFQEAVGETRVNLKIIDTNSGEMTELNERGFEAGSAYSAFLDTLREYLPGTQVLTLSGSLPPDLGASVYRDLTALADSYGVRVILDADGEALRKGVEAKPFAIKPNIAEFRALAGEDVQTIAQIVSAARRLAAKGIGLVAVSCGADGAVFVRGDRALRTVPFPIEVGSAAAAGDSMVAALAWSIARDLPLDATARLMTAAGTCTASLPGTQVAPLSEALSHAKDVEVRMIE